MLLTDSLIADLHSFRIKLMERSVALAPSYEGIHIGGGYARFAGEGSPLSQAYGLGHCGAEADLGGLDSFFEGKAENWELIVTPFTSAEVLKDAAELGYRPDHFETVLLQEPSAAEAWVPEGASVEEVQENLDLWARVADAGWTDSEDLPDHASDMWQSYVSGSGMRRYLARWNGQPAAAGAMLEIDGKFLFAGACTRPQFRKHGLQKALTSRRLADADGAPWVQVVALPGSESHRNAHRAGFEPVYSKLVMFRS